MTQKRDDPPGVAEPPATIRPTQLWPAMFWPAAAGVALGTAWLDVLHREFSFAAAAAGLMARPPPGWTSPNRVALDLSTMQLRDFSAAGAQDGAVPVLVAAPHAGNSPVLVDLAPGQSLVQVLLAAGLSRVLVTDWKTATVPMRDLGIDAYLADLDLAVESLGGVVNLVGICQGGWMSAMYAARFPQKVRTLVLAGAPIDLSAGPGQPGMLAATLPLEFYRQLVGWGQGRMSGRYLMQSWKNLHPGHQLGRMMELHRDFVLDGDLARNDAFQRWIDTALDLPGRYYLQVIEQLFQQNRLARGCFAGLGRTLSLGDVTCPVCLLAGAADLVAPAAQVFAAASLLGTLEEDVVRHLLPADHLRLFIGTPALQETWPAIARWIAAKGGA